MKNLLENESVLPNDNVMTCCCDHTVRRTNLKMNQNLEMVRDRLWSIHVGPLLKMQHHWFHECYSLPRASLPAPGSSCHCPIKATWLKKKGRLLKCRRGRVCYSASFKLAASVRSAQPGARGSVLGDRPESLYMLCTLWSLASLKRAPKCCVKSC